MTGSRPDYRPATFTRALAIWALLSVAAVCAIGAAVFLGSSAISFAESWQALFAHDDSLAAIAVYDLRLPRALAAFGTGGLLAAAGCLMQVLLRNPLADPYVLGLSGGAAVGALGAMLLGAGALLINTGAAFGALLSCVLVFVLANRDLARPKIAAAAPESPRLLLTGVMLAAAWGALITLILTLAPDRHLRGMLFWMIGDFGGVDAYALPLIALACVVLALAPLLRQLNVLLHGDAVAASLGVRVGRLRMSIFLIASIATAIAVTTAGAVGFVGLVVPHALRLAIGNDQRVLLPAATIAGGGLLVVADTIARVAFAPLQLPVGTVMVLGGVPAFLFLLQRIGR
ncbi:MAG: iron ABC transporter permease [Lysobacteraceae bacterium]|nr:MAG: iron ABC transporter permease [Xanthomonadaceae bacterium]